MSQQSQHILVVDDEASIRKVVARALGEAGYLTITVPDRKSALEALAGQRFQLAILDVQLPDANGLDLCEEIVRDYDIPVVMLTVVVDESDVVRALESGADDYVRKPFSPRELTARVASVLRRAQSDEPKAGLLEAGELRLDPRSHRAEMAGETLALSPTEFRLLALFVRAPRNVLSHDELLRSVWGDEYAGEHHMLHVTISRLRRKLARFGERVVLRTVPAVGYELVTGPA